MVLAARSGRIGSSVLATTRDRMAAASCWKTAWLVVIAACCSAASAAMRSSVPAPASSPSRPHIVAVLADDLGFYDTSLYNPASPTPNLLKLSKQGLRLDRHYVFRYCSPTRRAFLSGRFPNSITSVQPDGQNLCSDFLPLACTILSEKLASVGYIGHFVGKGHLGYETTDHLPINRGFKSHVGYLGGGESYFWGCSGGKQCNADPASSTHDMWHDDRAGADIVPEIYYSANFYTKQAVSIINDHPTSSPLFMYLPYQNVHAPNQLPPLWEVRNFSGPFFGDSAAGHTYANMLHMLDSGVANVTSALSTTGMWSTTLLLFSADNGGIGGVGNNHPLHKHDPWDGGTRSTAFLTGGFLPVSLRGTNSGDKLVAIADWYPTFCNLAGVSPEDNVFFADAEGGGATHGVDGVDVWPLLIGTNLTQPRAVTPTTEVSVIDASSSTRWWKLIILAGQSNYYTINNTHVSANDVCLEGRQPDPPMPGRTDSLVNGCPVCNESSPCLYDVKADPTETKNVALSNPEVVARLSEVLSSYKVYITGHLSQSTLQANYTALDHDHFGNFKGPCYYRKGGPLPPPRPSPPPVPSPSPAPPCTRCGAIKQDVHYPGGDIKHVTSVNTTDACCDLCKVEKVHAIVYAAAAPAATVVQRDYNTIENHALQGPEMKVTAH